MWVTSVALNCEVSYLALNCEGELHLTNPQEMTCTCVCSPSNATSGHKAKNAGQFSVWLNMYLLSVYLSDKSERYIMIIADVPRKW